MGRAGEQRQAPGLRDCCLQVLQTSPAQTVAKVVIFSSISPSNRQFVYPGVEEEHKKVSVRFNQKLNGNQPIDLKPNSCLRIAALLAPDLLNSTKGLHAPQIIKETDK